MWKCWLIGFGWSKRNPTWLDWFILLHMNSRQQSRGSKHRTELYLFATNLFLSLSLKIEDICYACECKSFSFSRGRLEACELCSTSRGGFAPTICLQRGTNLRARDPKKEGERRQSDMEEGRSNSVTISSPCAR